MSVDNTFNENSFRDYYGTENSDDKDNNDDLVNRLYAEIYYPSNNEIELGANVTSNAVPLSSYIIGESINRLENIQGNLNNKAISEFEVVREQKELAAEEFIQTNKKNFTDQEANNTAKLIKVKENKKSLSKKYKSKQPKNKHRVNQFWKKVITLIDEPNMDTKYNVLHKKVKQKIRLKNVQEETSEDSDSESILEVPMSPKPKPLLIDLQDSDDEDAGSSIDEDDLLEGRLHGKNAPRNDLRALSDPEVEIIESSLDQDTAVESNTDHKSLRNKNTSATTNYEHIHDIYGDIVLNCTTVQKGVRNIDEIKLLSRNIKQNRIETSNEVANLRKRLSRDISRDNSPGDVCASQKTCWTSQERRIETKKQTKKIQQDVSNDEIESECTMLIHNLKSAVQTLENTLLEVSCGVNDNLVVSQKRHSEDNSKEGGEADNSSIQKRQYTDTVQQDNQVALTPQKSGERIKRSAAFWDEYFFKPLPQHLKKFYNDSRGQENFNVNEIRRNMSNDSKKWAILDEDLMPSPRRNRYWNRVRCSNCQQGGHVLKDCAQRSKVECCYMCGRQDHMAWYCPQTVCLTCGRKQSTYCDNCDHCRILYCTTCHSIGHKKKNCPDLWRRYHSITKEISCAPRNPGNVMKPASQLHCCNCSKRGHESSTCKEYRWSKHFPTPPYVTNYTGEPVYSELPVTERISTNIQTPNVLEFKTTSNETSNQQMHKWNTPIMQETPPPDIDVLSSSTPAENKPTCASNIQEQTMTISNVSMLKFANVIYSCGNFSQKKRHPSSRLLVSNLSQHKEMYWEMKQFLQTRLSNGTVLPMFLKKLRKIVEFEITIGLLADQTDVMVQLMAPDHSIYQLFHLLLYWLNLPLNEKQHRLNVNLPMFIDQMYKFLEELNLSQRMSTDIKDPFKLYNSINCFKSKLCTMPKNQEYFHNQTRMWDMQTELLIFINSRPEPSIYFCKLLKCMETLKPWITRYPKKQVFASMYLDIVLSYNKIFTPHTPPNLWRTVIYAMRKRIVKLEKEQLLSNENIRPSISFMTSSSYTSGETVSNPFVNSQNIPYDMSNVMKMEDVNICQLGTSDAVENYMQYPQNTLPFDIKPITVQYENPQKQDDQFLTDNVNININLPVTKPNINIVSAGNKPIKQKKNKNKNKKQKLSISAGSRSVLSEQKRLEQLKKLRFRQEVHMIAKQTYASQLPYIVKAGKDMLKKFRNKKLKIEDLQKVKKMIKHHKISITS